MSIDNVTPAEWNRVRDNKTGLEAWMKETHKTDYIDPYDQQSSMVDRPPHYNAGEIECISYLEDNLGLGFEYYLEGNIKKYLHRFRHKGNETTDLEKARWYLNKLISHIKQED